MHTGEIYLSLWFAKGIFFIRLRLRLGAPLKSGGWGFFPTFYLRLVKEYGLISSYGCKYVYQESYGINYYLFEQYYMTYVVIQYA